MRIINLIYDETVSMSDAKVLAHVTKIFNDPHPLPYYLFGNQLVLTAFRMLIAEDIENNVKLFIDEKEVDEYGTYDYDPNKIPYDNNFLKRIIRAQIAERKIKIAEEIEHYKSFLVPK